MYRRARDAHVPRYNNKAAAAARAAWRRGVRRTRIPFHVTHCVFDRRIASNCIKKSENVPGILGVWKKCNNIVVTKCTVVIK